MKLRIIVAILGLYFFVGFGYPYIHLLLWGPNALNEIDAICETPPETPIRTVIERAQELGFSLERALWTSKSIAVFQDGFARPVWLDGSSIPDISVGHIVVGKSRLPPFMDNFCVLRVANGRVVRVRYARL